MPERRTPPSARTIATATLAGTTLEWYDFFLYGTAAALIFNKQFFPDLNPAMGTLAAFSTLAVGFLARPIGGLVFGHFGDRIGRKKTLVVSLLLMGGGSTLIGLIPNYATIGIWAPILLVLMRVLQGIGLGGEGAGAVLMSVEHAPGDKRNRFGGFPMMGNPAGLVLANLVFLATMKLMPDDTFHAWGWRIPFLLSFLLIAVGLVIRLRVTESPSFAGVQKQQKVVRFPLKEAVRERPAALLATVLAVAANSAVAYVFMVFSLSYGTERLDFGSTFMMLAVTGAALLWFATIPFWTRFADQHGRKRMFLAGSAALLLWCLAYFPLLDTGNSGAVWLAFAGMGLIVPVTHCLQGSIMADLFPPAVRYSGSSLVAQFGAIAGGGFAPMISSALLNATGSSTGVTLYLAAVCAVSLIAATLLFRLAPEQDRGREADPAPGSGAGAGAGVAAGAAGDGGAADGAAGDGAAGDGAAGDGSAADGAAADGAGPRAGSLEASGAGGAAADGAGPATTPEGVKTGP